MRETRTLQTTLAVMGIAVVAVLLRLTPLLRSDLSFAFVAKNGDWVEYLQLAQGIRHGCGFARLINGACQPREILRTPGYPLFLAAMPSVRWIFITQSLLGGIVCLLMGALVARYWNFTAAIIAEFLIAFDVPSIVMTTEVMSETLFQLAMALALIPPLVLIWCRPDDILGQTKILMIAAISGFLGGFAMLVRPIAIALPIVLPIPFLLAMGYTLRLRFTAAAIAIVVPLLILVGWSLRNYELAGYPGLSTVGAVNLYYYRAANVIARHDGIPFTSARDLLGPELGVAYENVYEASVQSPALTRRMKRLGFRILEAHPAETAAMTLQGILFIAFAPMHSQLVPLLSTQGDSINDGLNPGKLSFERVRSKLGTLLRSPAMTALILYQFVFIVVLWIGIAAALIRCIHERTEWRVWILYPTAAAILMMVLAAGAESEARFRAPVLPMLAIAASLGYFPKYYSRTGDAADATRA